MSVGYLRRQKGRERETHDRAKRTGKNNSIHLFRTAVAGGLCSMPLPLFPFWESHFALLLLPKCRTLPFMELTLSVMFRDS